jgi:hypothetical protein
VAGAGFAASPNVNSWYQGAPDAHADMRPKGEEQEMRRGSFVVDAIKHEKLRHNRSAHIRLPVPKSSGLTRDAILLPLSFRLPYAALLVTLFPHIVKNLDASCYSFSFFPDVDPASLKYPFPTPARLTAWGDFRNAYREALAQDGAWGVVTDISQYFEHIGVKELVSTLQGTLNSEVREGFKPQLEYLQKILLWAARDSRGIPQNYDPSSFFCSTMLTSLDREMSRNPDVKYFRYVDDVRIVVSSRGLAHRSLQRLQEACQKWGFFLNSKKTRIIEPNSPEHETELDVTHDQRIGEIEQAISTEYEPNIRKVLEPAMKAFRQAVGAQDGRLMRAYGSQILEIGKFGPLRLEALGFLKEISLNHLGKMPASAQDWSRCLSPDVDHGVVERLITYLLDDNQNYHPWSNMHSLITLTRSRDSSKEMMDLFHRYSAKDKTVPERCWAIIGLGKYGDQLDRVAVLKDFLHAESHFSIRRAAIIATQELPVSKRDAAWEDACEVDGTLRFLVEFLRKRSASEKLYGTFYFGNRSLVDIPKKADPDAKQGYGMIDGALRTFNRSKGIHEDYD